MSNCRCFCSLIALHVVLCAICFSWPASASVVAPPTAKSLCPIAKSQENNGKSAIFFQHAFDGVQDLAMGLSAGTSVGDDALNSPLDPNLDATLDIKRVTFGGSSAPICHYSNMAIARGGDWGWHLAWLKQGVAVLNYARMDGVAWVSSPIKKLSKYANRVNQLKILTLEQRVWVVWAELMPESGDDIRLVYMATSGDEGRTWDDARLLTKTSAPIDNFQLLVKENQPYLTWSDAESVLLPVEQ